MYKGRIIFLNTAFLRVNKDETLKFIDVHKNLTDIFAFQEVDQDCRDAVSVKLNSFNLHYSEKTGINNEQYFLGIWVNKKYKVISHNDVFGNEKTLPQAQHLEVALDGKIINIINFHGLPKPGDKLDTPERIQASRILINYLQKLKGEIIFGGDFNLDPQSKSLLVFEILGLKNLITKFKITNTRNEVVWRQFPETKQYFSDYIFTTPTVLTSNLQVPYSEMSDHLPMILDWEI